MVAAVAALIPLVAGCEAGANAPSLHWHQPTDGSGAIVGDITISNAFVLGAPVGQEIPAGQNAGLFIGLSNTSNQTTDHLVSVSAPGVAQSVKIPGNHVTLVAQNSVLLTGPKPQIVLMHLARPLTGGSTVTLTLDFAVAGQVTLTVPVMPRAQYYTTLQPAPAATTPSASPTPNGTGTAKSSPSSTPSPSSS
jgi:copper(I)-binding protein